MTHLFFGGCEMGIEAQSSLDNFSAAKSPAPAKEVVQAQGSSPAAEGRAESWVPEEADGG